MTTLFPLLIDVTKVDADPETFEVLSNIYAHDKNHAFAWGTILEGVDGATFRVINDMSHLGLL